MSETLAAQRPIRSWRLRGPAPLAGTFRVPGDKSLSHRALVLGAMAHGTTTIRGLLPSDDCRATRDALRQLGVEISESADGLVRVQGAGPDAWREPETVLDAGNSGTTLRMLAGALAGRPFCSLLTGDGSLRRRPMRRIVDPLRAMGATLLGRADGGFPPLAVRGGDLRGIAWRSPVASAQVKSAILLAGLQAEGETSVDRAVSLARSHRADVDGLRRDAATRGHHGDDCGWGAALRGRAQHPRGSVVGGILRGGRGRVPGGGGVCVREVGVNPTRTGILEVLEAMGARVGRDAGAGRGRGAGGGPHRLRARGCAGCEIGADLIPRLVDEVPVLAVIAALADGETNITGAGELRVKEVDRLSAVGGGARAAGGRGRGDRRQLARSRAGRGCGVRWSPAGATTGWR